jgi:hypothetical protein
MSVTGTTIRPELLKDMYDLAEASHDVHRRGGVIECLLSGQIFVRATISAKRNSSVTIILHTKGNN